MRFAALPVLALLAFAAPAFAQSAAPASPSDVPAPVAPTEADKRAAAILSEKPAADIGKIVDPNTIPALRNILQSGAQLRYIGDEYGLKGYFVTNNNQGQLIYITPDGQASIIGALFSGDGLPISALQLARLTQTGFDPSPYVNGNIAAQSARQTTAPAATPNASTTATANASTATTAAAQQSPGEQLMAEANQLSWIAYGPPSAPSVLVFMDPNCDHCHNLFKELQPLAAQGKIYMRVIPVSVIDPDKSRIDVLNILGSSDPAAAWANQINSGQSAPAVTQTDTRAEAALLSNNRTFNRWQLNVTPYSVYRSKATGQVKVMTSKPTDMAAFLADLGAN